MLLILTIQTHQRLRLFTMMKQGHTHKNVHHIKTALKLMAQILRRIQLTPPVIFTSLLSSFFDTRVPRFEQLRLDFTFRVDTDDFSVRTEVLMFIVGDKNLSSDFVG